MRKEVEKINRLFAYHAWKFRSHLVDDDDASFKGLFKKGSVIHRLVLFFLFFF